MPYANNDEPHGSFGTAYTKALHKDLEYGLTVRVVDYRVQILDREQVGAQQEESK
jgi:hypothetical protein